MHCPVWYQLIKMRRVKCKPSKQYLPWLLRTNSFVVLWIQSDLIIKAWFLLDTRPKSGQVLSANNLSFKRDSCLLRHTLFNTPLYQHNLDLENDIWVWKETLKCGDAILQLFLFFENLIRTSMAHILRYGDRRLCRHYFSLSICTQLVT